MGASRKGKAGVSGDKILKRLLRKLQQEPCGWLSSVRPDGRAHCVPVWHVLHQGRFYVCTRGDSVKVSNVQTRPGVVLSLPDPLNAVILEGDAGLAPEDRDAVRPLFAAKYEWDPDSSPEYDTILRIEPRKLMAWGKHGEGRWTRSQIQKAAMSSS